MKVFYTDGSCRGNPGFGAWGFTDLQNITKVEACKDTTNNRMELIAVIKCLEQLSENAIIHTDSEYVSKGVNEYMSKWKLKNWKGSNNKIIKNLDLWQQVDLILINLKNKNILVEIKWVRGHDSNYGNLQIDLLVQNATSNK